MQRKTKTSSFTKEFIGRVRDYYVNNDVSTYELADNSVALFGMAFTAKDCQDWSRNDPAGRWTILRANKGRKTEDVPVSEKLTKIADKLYESMIDEDDPVSPSVLSQIAKTWSDLLIKANMNKEVSAKTSTQAVKDMIARMEAENKRDSSNTGTN